MTTFYLLGNNGYSVQDTPEPEEWVKPLREAGLCRLEYFQDHMEPVYFETIVRDRSSFYQATMQVLRENGISVDSFTTGRLLYMTNGLSHPYEDARCEAVRWLTLTARTAAALGAPMIGGHFDYISIHDTRTVDVAAQKQRILDGMLQFGEAATAEGLEAIAFEQMYTPHLRPHTMAEFEEMLMWLNERSDIAFYPMCDVGHMAVGPQDSREHTAEDKDPYAWLARRYAGQETIFVHLQQTDAEASRHWPFTAEYNAQGFIDLDRAVASIEASGIERAFLSLEILFPRGTPIGDITPAVVESAGNVRAALTRAGYREERCCFTRN